MRYNHCSDGLINTLVCFSVNWMGKRREGRGLLKIWVNALNAMEDGLHLMQKRRGVKLGEERLQNEIQRGGRLRLAEERAGNAIREDTQSTR